MTVLLHGSSEKWYGGHFCQKAGKNLDKLGVGQKYDNRKTKKKEFLIKYL